jgi:hypothetical protein
MICEKAWDTTPIRVWGVGARLCADLEVQLVLPEHCLARYQQLLPAKRQVRETSLILPFSQVVAPTKS